MSSREFEGERGQAWVLEVADVTVEPRYISEIARKLIDIGVWDTDLTQGIVRASKGIQAFMDRHEDDEYYYKEVNPGHLEGSAHYQLGSEREGPSGISGSTEWRKYVLFQNRATGYDEITTAGVKDIVDPNVTVEEKEELIHLISNGGEQIAEDAELIMQDQIRPALFGHQPRYNIDEKIDTGFNDPGIDSFVVASSSSAPTIARAYEVSTRWVNPIDQPYIDEKTEASLDMEAEAGMEVDLVMMAPKYREFVAEPFIHTNIVPVSHAYGFEEPLGTVVIVRDPDEVIERLRGTPIVGDRYPVVDSDRERFREALETVGRPWMKIEEAQYRFQLIGAIENNLPV